MSEVFLVYLWLKLDTISAVLFAVSAVTIIGTVIWAGPVVYSFQDEHGWETSREARKLQKAYRKTHKWLWWSMIFMAIFCFLVGHLLPTPKQAAALVGTHYAVQLAGSPEGQKVMTLIRKKANDYLDEQLKEEVKK